MAALARVGDAAGDDVTGRLDGLLERVKDDEEARREYVDLLEMLGSDDPRTAAVPAGAGVPPVLTAVLETPERQKRNVSVQRTGGAMGRVGVMRLHAPR